MTVTPTLSANLPLYWTSVHVEPRYLLMFVPLFNTVGLYLLAQHQKERSGHFRLLYGRLVDSLQTDYSNMKLYLYFGE